MAVVVFPTPPFWLQMAMVCTKKENGGRGVLSSEFLSAVGLTFGL